jgi:PAS domain S-box-containing protein
MKRAIAYAVRIATLLAFVLSLVLALILPISYFTLSYERLGAVMDAESASVADAASQLISASSDYWRYQQPRLEGILQQRISSASEEVRRILDADGAELASAALGADNLPSPVITRSHTLYDAGVVMGSVEIRKSLRPVLLQTAWFFLAGLVLGASAFILFRLFPLHALDDALRSLQESEARFRVIAATAADGLVVMDEHGRITYWNTSAEKMFGCEYNEAVGRDLGIFLAPESLAGERPDLGWFEHAGNGEGESFTREFIGVHKSGARFPVEISAAAVQMQDAQHSVALIRNVTERKRTEAELLKLEKLESVGVLAGGLAHDFNNLLTVMLGSIALAQLDAASPELVGKRLEEAEKAVIRARGLTQQLLTFSKGGTPMKKTASIPELVEESCSFYLSGSNVKCSIAVGDGLKPADVDSGQIGQVLRNLILNAVQAMHSGGMIRVKCDNFVKTENDKVPVENGEYVLITVSDEGPGIDGENLPKIFDPFFTTKAKGTGLGLALSYSIIKKHGGHISVESEPGKGATFHVYLPASQQAAAAARKINAGPLPGRGRVLVMDDEEAVLRVAGDMLTALGYEPALSRDGEDAVARYRSAASGGLPFHAVIMDITVPGGMGGKDAVKLVLDFDPKARVLVSSGYSNDPVMANYKEYGFIGVIAKPYSLAHLGQALRDAIA